MIIQSRKHPEKTWDVTLETWNNLKASGESRKFRILSSIEIAPDSTVMPVEVENFLQSKKPEVEKIYDDNEPDQFKGLTKQELIELYDELELDMSMKRDDIIEKIIKSQE